MANENDADRVSREAHERVTAERDQFKQLADQARTALADMQAREKARLWFKDKGAPDPDLGAEAAFPHLRGVEPEKYEEVLSRGIFDPYLAASGNTTPPAPAVEPSSGFSGTPSPGAGGVPITGATATISQLQARGFDREQIVAELKAGRAVPDDNVAQALRGQDLYRQRGR